MYTTTATATQLDSKEAPQTINRLFLTTLLLAEITRLKSSITGDNFSLTNRAIERNARKSFANLAGIPERSKPKVFLQRIKEVMNDNELLDRFYSMLLRFRFNGNFEPIEKKVN